MAPLAMIANSSLPQMIMTDTSTSTPLSQEETPALCLIVEIPQSSYKLHQTSDDRFLLRVGSHRRLIPAEQLARLLSGRYSAVRSRTCTICGLIAISRPLPGLVQTRGMGSHPGRA